MADKMEICLSTPPLPSRDAVSRAFRIPLVLEKIVDYVIHDNNKIVIPEVCSVRQVSSEWLRAATGALVKSGEVVFRIEANPENSTSGTAYVQENGRILDQLKESVTLRQRICVPLYSIKTTPHLFQQNTHEELLDCLNKCGDNIVELSYPFPRLHIPMPIQPNALLSHLRSFTMDTVDPEYIDKAIPFIQSVFDASRQLRSLNLTWALPNSSYISEHLSNFVLPTTLTDITFLCPLDGDHMTILSNNSLPNLKSLTLGSSADSNIGEHLFNIFENVRETLEKFWLHRSYQDYRAFTKITFPLMHKLKTFILDDEGVVLDDNNARCLEQLLPALKHLTLAEQTPSDLQKWTGRSHFDSVSSLTVSFSEDELLFPEVSTYEMLTWAFPNLVRLDITLYRSEALENVKHLFQKLKSLQDLTIRLADHVELRVENCLDAILTGLPKDRLDALRENPDLQDELQLEHYPDSIRNLTNLKNLRLEFLFEYDTPLISDAAFQFAFFKLPKLFRLTLVGGVQASAQMTEAWKQAGRFIENREDSIESIMGKVREDWNLV